MNDGVARAKEHLHGGGCGDCENVRQQSRQLSFNATLRDRSTCKPHTSISGANRSQLPPVNHKPEPFVRTRLFCGGLSHRSAAIQWGEGPQKLPCPCMRRAWLSPCWLWCCSRARSTCHSPPPRHKAQSSLPSVTQKSMGATPHWQLQPGKLRVAHATVLARRHGRETPARATEGQRSQKPGMTKRTPTMVSLNALLQMLCSRSPALECSTQR